MESPARFIAHPQNQSASASMTAIADCSRCLERVAEEASEVRGGAHRIAAKADRELRARQVRQAMARRRPGDVGPDPLRRAYRKGDAAAHGGTQAAQARAGCRDSVGLSRHLERRKRRIPEAARRIE